MHASVQFGRVELRSEDPVVVSVIARLLAGAVSDRELSDLAVPERLSAPVASLT